MATMNVSLPDAMKKWVEERVATGDYGNASDYVRDLIRKDKSMAEAKAAFDAEIQKGLDSGWSDLTLEEIMAEAREIVAKHPSA